MLPFTVFLKLKDIGGNILPTYQEEFIDIAMSTTRTPRPTSNWQANSPQNFVRHWPVETPPFWAWYSTYSWPGQDCCFRPEIVKHIHAAKTR